MFRQVYKGIYKLLIARFKKKMAKSQLVVYNLFPECNDIFIFRNQMHVQLILKDSLQLSGRTVNYGVVVSVFPSSS